MPACKQAAKQKTKNGLYGGEMKKNSCVKTSIRAIRRNVRILIMCLLVAVLCLPFWAFGDVSATNSGLNQIAFLPVQDSYIQHDYPYYDPRHDPSLYNYGGSPFLNTVSSAQSNDPRILVQFDLSSIPQDAGIISAYLKLYCFSGGIWKSIGCYSLTRSWVEGTMNQQKDPPLEVADGCTWNTYDGIDNWTNPGGDYNDAALLDEVFIADNSDVGWKAWNVTAAVENWVNRSIPNHGFILTTLVSGNYREARFYSKEYSEPLYWPRLEVVYEIPEESLITDLSVTPEALNPYEDSRVEISYQLEEESSIQIEIYNPEGEKVKALFEDSDEDGAEIEKPERQEAGSHSKEWCGVIDFPEMTALNGDKGVLLAPDGEYIIKLIATSINDDRTDSAEVEVTVE